MSDNPIGAFVAEERSRQRLSQADLAKRCAVSQSYIAQLERGLNPKTGKPINPTMEKLEALARGLRVDPQVLIDIARGKTTPTPEPQPALERITTIIPYLPPVHLMQYPVTEEELRLITEADSLGVQFLTMERPEFWEVPAEERRGMLLVMEQAIRETKAWWASQGKGRRK